MTTSHNQHKQITLNIVTSNTSSTKQPIHPTLLESTGKKTSILSPSLPPHLLQQIKADLVSGNATTCNIQLPPGITSIKQPLPAASVINVGKYKSVPSPFISLPPINNTISTGNAIQCNTTTSNSSENTKPTTILNSSSPSVPYSKVLVVASSQQQSPGVATSISLVKTGSEGNIINGAGSTVVSGRHTPNISPFQRLVKDKS